MQSFQKRLGARRPRIRILAQFLWAAHAQPQRFHHQHSVRLQDSSAVLRDSWFTRDEVLSWHDETVKQSVRGSRSTLALGFGPCESGATILPQRKRTTSSSLRGITWSINWCGSMRGGYCCFVVSCLVDSFLSFANGKNALLRFLNLEGRML